MKAPYLLTLLLLAGCKFEFSDTVSSHSENSTLPELSQPDHPSQPEQDHNRPPLIDAIAPISIQADQSHSLTINASDPDQDELSYRLLNAPDWVSHDHAKITLKPTQQDLGDHRFSVHVSDGQLSAQSQLQVRVTTQDLTPPLVQLQTLNDLIVPIAVGSQNNLIDWQQIADGSQFTLMQVGTASKGHAHINQEQLIYSPKAGNAGQDSFEFWLQHKHDPQRQAKGKVILYITPELIDNSVSNDRS